MVYYQWNLFQSNAFVYHCVIIQTLHNGQTLGQFFEPLYTISCLCWQPGHGPLTCPHNYQPTSHSHLCHSPCIQKKTLSYSTSPNQLNPTRPKMIKKPKQGSFVRPVPSPPPEEKGKWKEEQQLLKNIVKEIWKSCLWLQWCCPLQYYWGAIWKLLDPQWDLQILVGG